MSTEEACREIFLEMRYPWNRRVQQTCHLTRQYQVSNALSFYKWRLLALKPVPFWETVQGIETCSRIRQEVAGSWTICLAIYLRKLQCLACLYVYPIFQSFRAERLVSAPRIDLVGFAGVAVYSVRAQPLSAWTKSYDLANLSADPDRACLVLETGVNQRWRYASFRRTAENVEEAAAWQDAKQACRCSPLYQTPYFFSCTRLNPRAPIHLPSKVKLEALKGMPIILAFEAESGEVRSIKIVLVNPSVLMFQIMRHADIHDLRAGGLHFPCSAEGRRSRSVHGIVAYDGS